MKALFGDLPRSYWLLVVGMFVNRVGGFVLPFLSLYLVNDRRLGAGPTSAVLAAWGAGTVLAGAIGGQLADRWGRKPTMLASLCGGAAVLTALAFAHDFAVIAALAFLLGTVAELYRPAVAAAIADLAPPEQRARAFGNLTWAYNLGFAVSPVIAGLLIERVGYAALFAGDALTMLLAAVLIAACVPETRTKHAQETRKLGGSVLSALTDRRFAGLVFAALMIGGIVIQLAASLAHVMEGDAIGASLYGRLIAVNGLMIALTQPWIVPLFERVGRWRILPCSALLFGFGFALHAVASTPAQHVLAIVVWSLAEVALFPACNAAVADLAPEHMRGRYQGTYWMAWAFANVVGPPIGLFALERGGESAWGFGIASAGLIAALALANAGAHVKRAALANQPK